MSFLKGILQEDGKGVKSENIMGIWISTHIKWRWLVNKEDVKDTLRNNTYAPRDWVRREGYQRRKLLNSKISYFLLK